MAEYVLCITYQVTGYHLQGSRLAAICEQSVLLQAPADEAAAACVTLNPALNLQQPRFD